MTRRAVQNADTCGDLLVGTSRARSSATLRSSAPFAFFSMQPSWEALRMHASFGAEKDELSLSLVSLSWSEMVSFLIHIYK